MKREILINGSQRETRVAILEDDRLVELLVDRPDHRRTVGDIYLGRVEAVLPGIQAAFVDIGLEKSAFLHASDLLEPDEDEDPVEDAETEEEAEADPPSARRPRRHRPRRRRASARAGGGDVTGAGVAGPSAARRLRSWPPSTGEARQREISPRRAAAEHSGHAQEGPDPARSGHQGADLHQGLPRSPRRSRSPAASSSTCRTPPRSA